MLFEKDSGEWLSVRVRNRSSWVAGSEADGAGEGRRWWATEDERKEVMVEGEGEGYSVECKSLSIFDQKSNVVGHWAELTSVSRRGIRKSGGHGSPGVGLGKNRSSVPVGFVISGLLGYARMSDVKT